MYLHFNIVYIGYIWFTGIQHSFIVVIQNQYAKVLGLGGTLG